MRTLLIAAVVVAAATAAPGSLGAQSSGSDVAATVPAARDTAGAAAGARASVAAPSWRAAAFTFFLTPMVGGPLALRAAGRTPACPVPALDADGGSDASYAAACRAAYAPRQRRAMRRAMLGTSVFFFAAAAAFSG